MGHEALRAAVYIPALLPLQERHTAPGTPSLTASGLLSAAGDGWSKGMEAPGNAQQAQ